MTLSITTLCNYAEGHYYEYHKRLIIRLNVIKLSVVILNVVMPSIVRLSVVSLNVVAPHKLVRMRNFSSGKNQGSFSVFLNTAECHFVSRHLTYSHLVN